VCVLPFISIVTYSESTLKCSRTVCQINLARVNLLLLNDSVRDGFSVTGLLE
jgi:hypothetical protein